MKIIIIKLIDFSESRHGLKGSEFRLAIDLQPQLVTSSYGVHYDINIEVEDKDGL